MKQVLKTAVILLLMPLFSSLVLASDNFDQQRSDGVSDKKWSSLKMAVQETKLTASDGAVGDSFGYSVSLSGNRALVGAYKDDDNGIKSGSAYIYDYDGMNWSQSAKLTPSDGAVDDWFGLSVSLSSDRVLVGAPFDDDNGISSGSAYVFDYDGMSWSQSAKLLAGDGEATDYFGYSVSLSGNRVLVGAYGDDDNGSSIGSAYVYDFDGMNWNQSSKLTAGDGAATDWFGYSVSLSDDRALVGAYLDDDNGTDSGSAYVYDYDGMSWSQSAKLVAGDGATNDSFGYSVSLSGDRALVGARWDDDNGSDSGSAYVFDYDGMSWSQSTKLTANDGAPYDYYGWSVILSDDRALVGAIYDDDNGGNSGSAYIYDYDGVNWNQSNKLSASDGEAQDQFGRSVSLSSNRVFVGAPFNDDNGSSSGSAYIFNLISEYDVNVTVNGLAAGNSVDVSNGGVTNAVSDVTNTTSFTLDDGSAYAVTTTNATTPNQTCSVTGGTNGDGSGTLNGADVAITITCVTNTYDLNVTVNGLAAGNSVDVSNGGVTNAVSDVSNTTSFTLDDGTGYAVTTTNATTPNQTCSVTGGTNGDGSGALNGADVTITITCVTNTYDLNVTVNGLAAGNSVEVSNGGVTNAVSDIANTTSFTLDDGTAYVVTTTNATTPNQTCSVTGGTNSDGSGTLNGADVAITITCVTNQYSVGGIVSGLATGNEVILQNNTGDDLTVSANGSFTFATQLDDESPYAVTVLTNPSTPNQTCAVTGGTNGDGTGVLAGNDDTSVVVTCVTNQYSVGGNVSGLAAGNEVILQNNTGDDLTVSANGSFNFATQLDDESPYAVTVLTNPTTPNQTCTVTGGTNGDGSGVLAGNDDTSVVVACVTNQYSVGGNVSGLAAGNEVILQNNVGDNLTVSEDGSFTFTSPIDDETMYEVTVLTQPTEPNQLCTVTQGSGQIAGGDVDTVEVNCVTDVHTIGGAVSGLAADNSVTLSLNSGEQYLVVDNNSSFEFNNALEDGSSYVVTVLNSPTTPSQSCSISNGTGTLMGDDVTDIDITCEINQYFIGGYLSDLIPGNSIMIQNNGGDDLILTADGAFAFATPLDDESGYEVTIQSQPDNPIQPCDVLNDMGTLDGDDVDNVLIDCDFGDDLIYRHGFDTPYAISRELWDLDD